MSLGAEMGAFSMSEMGEKVTNVWDGNGKRNQSQNLTYKVFPGC